MDNQTHLTFTRELRESIEKEQLNLFNGSDSPLSPSKSPTLDPVKSLLPQRSKTSGPDEGAENAEVLQIDCFLENFNKLQPLEKFNAFMTLEPQSAPQKTFMIYERIKEFRLPPPKYSHDLFRFEHEVSCLASSPGSHFLAIGFEESGIAVAQFKNIRGKKPQDKPNVAFEIEPGKDSAVRAMVIDGLNNLYYSGEDPGIKKYSLSQQRLLNDFRGNHSSPVICLSVSSEVLASGDKDGQVILWDLRDELGEEAQPRRTNIRRAHSNGWVNAVRLSYDSRLLYSGGFDEQIKCWGISRDRSGALGFELRISINGHSGSVLCLTLRELRKDDNSTVSLLASGGSDNMVKVWELDKLEGRLLERVKFEGHSSKVTSLDFSPDGGLLVSSSSDKLVRVWNVVKLEPKRSMDDHNEMLKSLIVTANGKKIISAGGRTVMVWSFDRDYEKHQLQAQEPVAAILIIPDDTRDNSFQKATELARELSRAVCFGTDGKMTVWDISRVKTLYRNCDEHKCQVRLTTSTLDWSRVASADVSGKVVVWDSRLVPRMKRDDGFKKDDVSSLHQVQLFNAEPVLLRFSIENPCQLISASINGTVKVYDYVTQRAELSFSALAGPITGCELNTEEIDRKAPVFLAVAARKKFAVIDLGSQSEAFQANLDCGVVLIRGRSKGLLALGLDNGDIQVFTLRGMAFKLRIKSVVPTPLLCMEFLSDYQTLVVSFQDKRNSIRLLDTDTGEQVGLEESPAPVTSFALSPDDSKLICNGRHDNILRILILHKLQTTSVLRSSRNDDEEGPYEVKALDISEDQSLMASGANDSVVTVWELRKLAVKNRLKGHMQKVLSVKFTLNENKLVSGSADHTLRLWDVYRGLLLATIPVAGWVSGLALSSFGQKAFAACHSGGFGSVLELNFNESDKEKQLVRVYTHETHVKCLAVSKGELFMVSADKAGFFKVFEFLRKAEVHQRKAHAGGVNDLLITSCGDCNGMRILTCGADMEIKVWHFSHLFETTLLNTLKGHSGEVLTMSIDFEGTRLFSAGNDKSIMVWDLLKTKRIAELEGHIAAINVLCAGRDGISLYSGSEDKTIRVWNLRDSRQLPFLDGHYQPITRLVLTPDQSRLISGGLDRRVIVWDLASKKQLRTIGENDGEITGLAVFAQGTRIIVGTSGHRTRVYDYERGGIIDEISYEMATCSDLYLSKSNSHVFIGYSDSVVRHWELKSKTFVGFRGHHGSVLCLLMNFGENRLISGGDDKTVIVWDVPSSTLLRSLGGHSKGVIALALSRNEALLFSGGSEGLVIVWDFNFGTLIRRLEAPGNNPVTSLAISPDQRSLLVGFAPEVLSGEKRRNLLVYSLSEDYRAMVVFENSQGCTSLVFGSTGRLFTANRDKSILMYDYGRVLANSQANRSLASSRPTSETRQFEGEFKGHSRQITAEAISGDNYFIALADDDFVITVWDLRLCQRKANFTEHSGQIRCMLWTSNHTIISASDDMSIGVWELDPETEDSTDKKKRLQGHDGPVLALALSADENYLISSSQDQTIILWSLEKRTSLHTFRETKPDIITALYMKSGEDLKNLTFLAAGREKRLTLWSMDVFEDTLTFKDCYMKISSEIEMITMSPNQKILVVFLASKRMQLWDFRSLTLMCEFPCPQFRSKPVFLFEKGHLNRLALFYDKLIDCFTGYVVFSFQTQHPILSFYYDFKSHYFLYISDRFEIFQIKANSLAAYLFKYLNYDSLGSIPKDPNVICDRKMSSFPFFFTFLHLISIFDRSQFLTKEKILEVFDDEPDLILSIFYSLDLYLNTPLDILVQRKNPTLIIKYFGLLFQFMRSKSTNFFQKSRFFTYSFREDNPLTKLLVDLTTLLGDDLAVLDDFFDLAMMSLDPSLYDNSFIYPELDDPVLIETNSLFTNDKRFVEEKLKEFLKKADREPVSDSNGIFEQNQTMVKARIICLPGLNNINDERTNSFYSNVGSLEASNEIFRNKTLETLVDFIWDTQISFYYKIELAVFLVFFSLFNLNFLFLYQYRANGYDYQNEQLNIACNVIDVLIIVNSLYTLANESQQLFQGITQYFKYIWNYFDITLIPLSMTAAICDILLIHIESFRENLPGIKVVFAVSMFCLWFRFLSFFRALKETSFMIRLIFNVLLGVKNFILFMVIFLLNMSCSFYLLHTDTVGEIPSLWDTCLIYWNTVTGDTSGITDYDLIITEFADFYLIASSFLFAIMLMNLLVSIISDVHTDIKDAEQKTRLYEKMNILCDTNSSLTTNIAKRFFPPKPVGTYIIQLYNDKHEKEDLDEWDSLHRNVMTDMDKMVRITNDKIEDVRKELLGLRKATLSRFEELSAEIGEKLRIGKEEQVKELIAELRKELAGKVG